MPCYSDPNSISQANQDALRRMYLRAVARKFEVTNPVDRFILLLREAVVVLPVRKVLYNVGLERLLRSVVLGHYDFIGSEPPTERQRKLRAEACVAMLPQLDGPIIRVAPACRPRTTLVTDPSDGNVDISCS